MSNLKKKLGEIDLLSFLSFYLRHPASLFHGNKEVRKEYWKNFIQEYKINEDGLSQMTIQPLSMWNSKKDQEQEEKQRKESVLLAGKNIEIDLDRPDWKLVFADPEDVAAYHRFMWLYREVVERLSCDTREKLFHIVKSAIYSWIDFVEPRKKEEVHEEVWQTYTVSERVSNWLFLLGILADQPFRDEKIMRSVIRQANFIQANLEYYGERFTGNHLTNDGRCLYIVGAMLGIEYFKKLGKLLIKEEYERVIFEPGFLREGSTHYQILYTKWFTDLYWISLERKDTVFSDWIKPRLASLAKCSEMFLYGNHKNGVDMPFFGDISPDYQPRWIMGAPAAAHFLMEKETGSFIPKSIGYHSLFDINSCSQVKEAAMCEQMYIKNQEWARCDKDGYTIHARVFHNLFPNNAPGHFHRDTGSFTLAYKGEKVIVDPGRVNYSDEGASYLQKSCFSHNQIIVDGKCPEVAMKRIFTSEYLAYLTGVKPEMVCHDGIIKIRYSAGRIVKGVKQYKRVIRMEAGEIVINDAIEGCGVHDIEFALHIHPRYQVYKKDENVQMSSKKQKGCIEFYNVSRANVEILKCDGKYGNYSEWYGDEKKCNVVLFKVKAKLPFYLKTRISMEEI